MKVELRKPHTFEGKEYTEIEMDLDGLTGKDFIDASKESRLVGNVNPVQEFCPVFLACVAAKAAKVPVDLIQSLSAKDFTEVKAVVQNFLLY